MYLFPLTLSESFVFLQKGDRDKASQDYTLLFMPTHINVCVNRYNVCR